MSAVSYTNQIEKRDLKSNVLPDNKNKVPIMEYVSLQFTTQK